MGEKITQQSSKPHYHLCFFGRFFSLFSTKVSRADETLDRAKIRVSALILPTMKVRTLIMGKMKVSTLILALSNVSKPPLNERCHCTARNIHMQTSLQLKKYYI